MRRRPLHSVWLVTALAILLAGAAPALAHEIRPALLSIVEQDSGRFDVTWKVPMRGDMVLTIEPVLPASLTQFGPTSDRVIPGARIQRMSFKSDGGSLIGEEISIEGLSALQIDVLLCSSPKYTWRSQGLVAARWATAGPTQASETLSVSSVCAKALMVIS